MFGIGHLLSRVKNKQTKEFFVRQVLVDMLKQHLNIDLEIKDIAIRNGTAIISGTNSAQKSEIYMKKSQIIESINKQQAIINIIDIR